MTDKHSKSLLKHCLWMLLLINTTGVYTSSANNIDSLREVRKAASFKIEGRSIEFLDIALVQQEDWTALYRIPEHPAFDSLLTPGVEREILAQINQRRREHGSDALLTADYFYVWRPYFDWLRNKDPHYRIYPVPLANPEKYSNIRQVQNNSNFRVLPFQTYTINDTIVVRASHDPLFKAGDMVISINDVPVAEYLKYSYDDRYLDVLEMMLYYYYGFAVDEFKLQLLRGGTMIEVETSGHTYKANLQKSYAEEYDPKVYDDAKCGYVQIRKFYPHNGRLIKIVHNAIKDFKKRGVSNVIIDIRRNPGGSGHSFDKLLSMFIDKPSIPYIKSQKLKVSKQTLGDYDFLTKDMIGQLVEIPDKYLVKEVKLDPRMYVEGMNYYVLISKDTGSIAASFANILQYNGAAELAGESLMHNALKYGETVQGDDLLPTLLMPIGISTTEINEYTKAIDGVLMPDIDIPYIAKEYLLGKDTVLEKLLEAIKKPK